MNRILFFSWTHLWSMNKKAGAPSYHHTITHYIESDEWDVYLFTADKSNLDLGLAKDRLFVFSDDHFVEDMSQKPAINHLFLPLKHKHYTEWAVKTAEKILGGDNGSTIIYAYEIWGVQAAAKMAKQFNIPLVTRFQGTILSAEKQNFYNRIVRYPHFEALEMPADLVVMTDDGTKGDAVLKELGNDSPLLFLRNGLDLYETYEEIYRNSDIGKLRQELGIEENERILLMASRLTSWKRVDRGIRALKEVIKTRDDVKLYIAGDGDCRKALEDLAMELDVIDHVKFLGSVPHASLYKYMLSADIFLSLYDLSNLGNPLFEAMLMKKAIIALNTGATSSVLCYNENAVLLEVDEVDRIPGEISHILQDKTFKETLEKNAYEYAVEHFYSWDTRMKIEEDAVKKLLRKQ